MSIYQSPKWKKYLIYNIVIRKQQLKLLRYNLQIFGIKMFSVIV